jgi:multidrug efflux pump subunit AcrA (membrane-fusion protein)
MSKNVKRITICLAAASVVTALILLIPGLFMKSLPTALPVKIAKVSVTDSVTAEGNIFRNDETGIVSVQMFVDEKDISRVNCDLYAEVTGAAFPDVVYKAKIAGIASQAAKITTGTNVKTVVEVWAQILYPDEQLKSGYTATVKILTGAPERKRLLPYDIIGQDDGGEYIYVLKNGTAVKRYITTGDELPEGVEIVSGLDVKEEVISVPEDIEDGEAVLLSEADDDV